VATGEKVIASRKSQTHTFIKTYYGDALAVDMESHAHMLSAHAHAIPALVIRGISDLVASKKESDQAGWQERAAANAAAFMFSVLSKLERTTLKNDRIIAPFIGWETIDSLLNTLYRDIEKNFAPDFVITMSGPGSFAACYCMGLNLRDIAVLFATTFPRRDTPNSAQQTFRELAEQSGWFHIATDKWDVYLPNVLRLLPKGSKVLIFDDRVISGETQRKLKSKLEEFDYDVRCAAMLTGDAATARTLGTGRRVISP
jgi:hypoxanthine phosphoribosyltransferase